MVRPVVCEVFHISAQHMNIHALPVSRCAPSICVDFPGRDAVTTTPAKCRVALSVCCYTITVQMLSTRAEQAATQAAASDLMLVGVNCTSTQIGVKTAS